MFNPKYKKYIIGLSILAFAALIISFFIRKPDPVPQLISSTPRNGSTNVPLDQTITLSFDLPLSDENLKATSIPQDDWNITRINSSTIQLTHQYSLHAYTDYQLTLSSGTTNLTVLTFTTVASQSDPRLVQTIEAQMALDYPLSRATPFDTPQYSVVYSAPLTLEITLKNPNLTSQEVIDQVKAWVTKNGGDADAHLYVFANQ